jgi:hypothetical protein
MTASIRSASDGFIDIAGLPPIARPEAQAPEATAPILSVKELSQAQTLFNEQK